MGNCAVCTSSTTKTAYPFRSWKSVHRSNALRYSTCKTEQARLHQSANPTRPPPPVVQQCLQPNHQMIVVLSVADSQQIRSCSEETAIGSASRCARLHSRPRTGMNRSSLHPVKARTFSRTLPHLRRPATTDASSSISSTSASSSPPINSSSVVIDSSPGWLRLTSVSMLPTTTRHPPHRLPRRCASGETGAPPPTGGPKDGGNPAHRG